jgi:ribonucleoside-diphosphate reductase alpha chain
VAKMPKNVNWDLLREFEKEDTTSGGRELACTAGVCEVVDIEAA